MQRPLAGSHAHSHAHSHARTVRTRTSTHHGHLRVQALDVFVDLAELEVAACHEGDGEVLAATRVHRRQLVARGEQIGEQRLQPLLPRRPAGGLEDRRYGRRRHATIHRV